MEKEKTDISEFELFYKKEELTMTEKEKTDFVSGKFLTCITNFEIFKKGEQYWLEYIGDDNYIGRSDNILNEQLHITEFELQKYFDTEELTELDMFLWEWFYGMRTWGLLCGQTNDQFCDTHAHEAKKELVNLINANCQDEIVSRTLKSKDINKYGCLEGDWQIAQESVINAQPFDFASIEYGAIKMVDWMTEKTIEWLILHFKTNTFGETQSYDFKSTKDMVDNFKKYINNEKL